MNERAAAKQLSDFLDHPVVAKPETGVNESPTFWSGGDALDPATRQTIARLSALPDLLPAPDPSFEQRVWQRVRAVEQTQGSGRRPLLGFPAPAGRRLRWLAPLAALVLAILVLLPGPRTVLGNWMTRIRLSKVDLVLAPESTTRPTLAPSNQTFASIEEAERAVGFRVLAPAYLPAGYGLQAAQSVSYEQLPVWMRPLYVETTYGPVQAGPQQASMTLRQFNARKAGDVQVGEIEYQSQDIRATRALTLANGAPAVLLEFRQSEPPLRELIWEHAGMTLELWSATLSDDNLVRVAESLH